MSKQSSKFAKAAKAAKRLYKTGRYSTFADAVKAAYKKIGGVSKKNRQTGTSNAKADRKRKAKAPGKRKSATGKTYYERRKNRSDKPGTLGSATATIRNILKQQLSSRLLHASLATTKREKRKWSKLASETKNKLKKFS